MTDIATINGQLRKHMGWGTAFDIQPPLDLDALKADYRNHKINLANGAQIEHLVPAPEQRKFLVPVRISRTMAQPLRPARALEFYVQVFADDAIMAAHLAGSIVRHRWAMPRHSMCIITTGVVEL